MLSLELTLESPAENLALDEALLLSQEESPNSQDVLRIWESRQTFVVLGSSSRFDDEVNQTNCRDDNVLVLRRPSGGAAVVTGLGCLMYSLVLSTERQPHLQAIDLAHCHVLGRLELALQRRSPGVHVAGTSDLALGDRKFSGNSMRCKRKHLLYHGTLLYDFPLDLVDRYLKTPPRQPEYRAQRPHDQFVTNLPLDRPTIVNALYEAFEVQGALSVWPQTLMPQLVSEKYSRDDWNRRI